jgi:hypothetical protein
VADRGEPAAVCSSVCTPSPNHATIQAAIDRLTVALGTASDDVIHELVRERAALRADLRALGEVSGDIVRVDTRRVRRT